ncbi:MAG: hypothetical protein K2J74_07230, partial [Muribaculaceae bacterium]|nr:hypothetical protein [Muribaculaceae bacterium]
MKRLHKILSIAALSTISISFRLSAITPTLYSAGMSHKAVIWTDSVFNSLTEEERIAQLFMPVVAPNDSVYGMRNMLQYVTRDHV